MKTTKSFDAVAESRRWKETVARQTEGMARDEVLAFFDKASAIAALKSVAGETCVVREEPTRKQS